MLDRYHHPFRRSDSLPKHEEYLNVHTFSEALTVPFVNIGQTGTLHRKG
jgi:hypothetical protein